MNTKQVCPRYIYVPAVVPAKLPGEPTAHFRITDQIQIRNVIKCIPVHCLHSVPLSRATNTQYCELSIYPLQYNVLSCQSWNFPNDSPPLPDSTPNHYNWLGIMLTKDLLYLQLGDHLSTAVSTVLGMGNWPQVPIALHPKDTHTMSPRIPGLSSYPPSPFAT